jgi:CMP-N-acetylneuraminic acid synthetase
MIGYTIDACQQSQLLTDWIVSTDDLEIAEISKKLGANLPFIRPQSISDDNIRNIDVLIHALQFMEELKQLRYDIIVLLQPTSPIRNPVHIDDAIKILSQSSLMTLASVKGPFFKRDPNLKKINTEGHLIDYCDSVSKIPFERAFYVYNASIYAMKRDHLLNKRSFISNPQEYLIMDSLHSIDVDEPLDFALASAGLKFKQESK